MKRMLFKEGVMRNPLDKGEDSAHYYYDNQ